MNSRVYYQEIMRDFIIIYIIIIKYKEENGIDVAKS